MQLILNYWFISTDLPTISYELPTKFQNLPIYNILVESDATRLFSEYKVGRPNSIEIIGLTSTTMVWWYCIVFVYYSDIVQTYSTNRK